MMESKYSLIGSEHICRYLQLDETMEFDWEFFKNALDELFEAPIIESIENSYLNDQRKQGNLSSYYASDMAMVSSINSLLDAIHDEGFAADKMLLDSDHLTAHIIITNQPDNPETNKRIMEDMEIVKDLYSTEWSK